MREIRRLGWTTIQMILALAVLAVIFAALVARAVTGPLRTMVEAVKRFSREQVVSELSSARTDEIGLLARSLNDMQATIVANMRELNESRQTLEHLAQHDSLTGLPNRALFDDRLYQALAQARRDQTRMAVLFVDLDGFKPINDTYGHAVGDALLVAEKICTARHQPFDLDGHSLVIAASIGAAIYPEHGSDGLTLSQRADAAMYLAKASGGNRAKLFGA